NQRLAKADEINQQLQSDVKVVTDKLKVTHADLVAARKQNKYATVAVDQKVTNLATSVKAELATKANNEDVNKLNGDVSGVNGDLRAVSKFRRGRTPAPWSTQDRGGFQRIPPFLFDVHPGIRIQRSR